MSGLPFTPDAVWRMSDGDRSEERDWTLIRMHVRVSCHTVVWHDREDNSDRTEEIGCGHIRDGCSAQPLS